jgi:hypothetical protein
MAYVYGEQKQHVFSEGGQVMFLAIRDNARNLIRKAGAATMERIIAGQCGDVWQMMACVDRLVELKELLEVPNTLSGAGQHRLFTSFDLS